MLSFIISLIRIKLPTIWGNSFQVVCPGYMHAALKCMRCCSEFGFRFHDCVLLKTQYILCVHKLQKSEFLIKRDIKL